MKEYIKYNKKVNAYRLLYNKSSNDWNDEPEYKMQKVHIQGESKDRDMFLIDSYSKKTFWCDKNEIFLNKKDFERKIKDNKNVADYNKELLAKVYGSKPKFSSTRSNETDISQKVKAKVLERDKGICVVCGVRRGEPNMHYISRAQGGLGIEENIVTGCQECHHEYDNGSKREETKQTIRNYLKSIYGESWNEESLIYNKWNNFKYN